MAETILGPDVEALIKHEIMDWSRQILEVPNEHYDGMPPCPYAQSAFAKDLVEIHVVDSIEDVSILKAEYEDHEKTFVIAWTEFDEMTASEFDDWIEVENSEHNGVWVMGFHPDSDPSDLIPEFEGHVADDYAIILVQSLSLLARASNALAKTGYYDKFPEGDIEYIRSRQETYDAWNDQDDDEEER